MKLSLSKKQIVIGVIFLLIIIAGCVFLANHFHKEQLKLQEGQAKLVPLDLFFFR